MLTSPYNWCVVFSGVMPRFLHRRLAMRPRACSACAEDGSPPTVRPVDPPARVWINVRLVLAASSHHIYRHVPGGLQTRYEVPGVLHEWAMGEDGARLGRVTYLLVRVFR